MAVISAILSFFVLTGHGTSDYTRLAALGVTPNKQYLESLFRQLPASSRNASIEKRIIDDNTDTEHRSGGIMVYQEAVDVGHYLVQLLNAPPDCVEQSKWTEYSDLAKYGWSPPQMRQQPRSPIRDSMIQFYELFNIDTAPEKNTIFTLLHNRESQPIRSDGTVGPGGKIYNPTGGKYVNLMNSKTIMAKYNYGTDWMGKSRGVVGKDVAPLKQWSDVVFLQWKQYCNNDYEKMTALEYIMRTDIINRSTNHINAIVLQKTGKKLQWWRPGNDPKQAPTFDVDHSDAAKALLATPNGQGIVWFLAQHKTELGLKVGAVDVFRNQEGEFGDGHHPLNILFVLYPHADAKKWRKWGEEQASKRRRDEL